MERNRYSSATEAFEGNDDSYHCTPVYGPSDIIYPGSDTEETPKETEAKRRRYEDAAKRYMEGERPRIISATLKGPFDGNSGWVNPWRYRPKKPKHTNWWQPGSENMLFTRKNVIARATAFGLGYMTPKEALAWCKASAQAELDSQYEISSRYNLMKSIEQDQTVEVEELDTGSDGEGQSYSSHRQEHSSTYKNYSCTPCGSINQSGGVGATKRPIDAKWLRGSYPSKYARWDGPVHPSPTPLATSNNKKKHRRRNLPDTHASLPSSNFKTIKQEMCKASERMPKDCRIGNSLQDPGGQVSLHRDKSWKSHLESSFNSQQQGSEDLDELWDNLYGADSISLSLSPEKSPIKLRSSPRDADEHSISELEPDELATTPDSKRLPEENNVYIDSNRLPTILRTTPPSRRHEIMDVEEDSFVTEIAPSSRDLEQFIFKKKRRIGTSESAQAARANSLQNSDECTSSFLNASKLIQPAMHQYRNDPPRYIGVVKDDIHESLSEEEGKEENEEEIQSTKNNVSIGSQEFTTRPVLNNSLPLQTTFERQEISTQSSSFISRSSQAPQATECRCSENLHVNIRTIPDCIQSQIQEMTSNLCPLHEPVGKVAKLPLPQLPEIMEATTGHDGSKYISKLRDLEDTKAQLYDATSVSSRRMIIQPPASVKQSPSARRLQRFSFESKYDSLLGSSNTASPGVSRLAVFAQIQAPKEVNNGICNENHTETEPDDHQACKKDDRNVDLHETHDTFIVHAPDRQTEEYGVMPMENNSSSATDQTQQVLYQKCSGINLEGNRRTPQSDEKLPLTMIPQTSQINISDPIHRDELLSGPSQNLHLRKSYEGLNLANQTRQEHIEVVDRKSGSQDVADIKGNRGTKLFRPDQPDLGTVNHKSQWHEPTNIEGNQGTPWLRGQQEIRVIDPKGTLREVVVIEKDAATTLRLETQLQSPFAQASCPMSRPPLEISKEDHPANITDTAAVSDEETESSWEGCGPQSPWALGADNNMDLGSPINPLSDVGSTISRVPLIDCSGIGSQDNIEDTGRSQSSEDEDSSIRPFKDLVSPSPPHRPHQSSFNEQPTSTQQLLDAALKNPWSSSLKRSTLLKTKKRVSFDHIFPDESDKSDDLEGPKKEVRKAPTSSPPPEEELLNEHIFGSGFKRTTPFKNHFSATMKFKNHIPSQNIRSPVRSSPLLSAQAEAFIAADCLERGQQPPDPKSPARPFKSRSDIDGNTHRKDSQQDGPSPMSSPPRQRTFASSMADFDMDEAIGQMGDFLEDWSVEAELKRGKELNLTKEIEDNGTRRRRLFGLE
jgi:hypothetical protein